MTVSAKLIGAVTSVVPVCVPDFYPGKDAEYAEFEIDSEPDWYFDDNYHATRHDISLRWYMPVAEDVLERKTALLDALCAAEFSLQSIEDIGDNLTQGYEYTLRYWEPVEEGTDGAPEESFG